MKSSITHNVDGKYIRKWLVLGPFFPDDLDTDFLEDTGGEASVRPEDGDVVSTADGRTLTWKHYESKGNIIDLLDAVGDHVNATAYAFCYLQSEMAGDVEIRLCAADGMAVWINGKQAHIFPDARWSTLDEELFETELKAGANCCLVKIYRQTYGWLLAMRINHKAISIKGALLMLDDITPHVAVPVQAIHDGDVVATALSDESGEYQFTGLKSGSYQVRCQILGGYVYYGEEKSRKPESRRAGKPESLKVEQGETLENINFRFAPFKKGTWRTYDTRDGLAHNAVSKICRAADGVMWIATTGGGVSRYDGASFVNLTVRDGLAHNQVSSIYCDPDGVVWFGTNVGVSRYDGDNFVTFTTADGLAHNCVHVIHGDPDGVIWFGTEGGVSRYDGKEFVNFTTEDGLAYNVVLAIQCDPDGVVWFGTGDGVSRYDGDSFANLTIKDGLAHSWVNTIGRDTEGVMWFGTHGGVSRYDGDSFVTFTTKDGLMHNNVQDIYCDPDGVIWSGMHRGCVSRYDGRGFVNFTTVDGLANYVVNTIHRDPDGTMWFGMGYHFMSQGGGVSRYDAETITNFTTQDGLPDNNIWSVNGAPDGTLWFGTWFRHVGAIRYDGREFVSLTKQDGLVHDSVYTIYCAPDGVTWFGTRGGVSRYDGKEFVNLTASDGLADNHVNAIHPDSQSGVMWFATWEGGISRYDGKEFRNFTTEDGLSGNTVMTIHRGPDGVMWFGAFGLRPWSGEGGVARYDGKEFRNLTTKDGLADNTVLAIHSDPDGMMWFGTNGGVSQYNGRELVNLTKEDGLANNCVSAIYRALDGLIWFGTYGGGVSYYDSTAWMSLDTRDGLAGNNVSSIFQSSDGYLWFTTEGGITRYSPGDTPPGIRILSVKIDEEYAHPGELPPITAGERVIIEYSAIDFRTIPEKRQYRCRIYETQGSRPKTQDSLESGEAYNLPTRETVFDWAPREPGEFIFAVQAIDRDLNYSEPATLSLTVQPDPQLISMQIELSYLRREEGIKYDFESIIGQSVSIRQVRALMERAIDSGLTVLIVGETGTGKELVAKAIHYNSTRKSHPLLDRNCGAIPSELLASDLFGHRKGAFTGAIEDKVGLFEAASGGTILLDEIGEMPQDAQIHLLRVLEEHKVQRLGEHISRDVDARIVAMTSRDLLKEVMADRFREDLYYRLSEFPIHIPPLRKRVEDISLLAEHFLTDIDKQLDGFAPGVFEMLQSYPWPGNIRELRNAIRRAAALVEEGEQIQTYHFPSQITQKESLIQEIASERVGLSASIERLQRRLIENALRESDGNRSQAARILGIHRPNLIRLMKRFEIE